MLRSSALSLGILSLFAAGGTQAVLAAPVTFTFDGSDNGLTTVTKTVDGVTITLQNFSPTATTIANSAGLCVGSASEQIPNGICSTLNSFEFFLSAPVQLISYQVGFLSTFAGSTQALTFSQGSNSSTETNFFQGVTTNFSTQFVVDANAIISVERTADIQVGLQNIQFSQITVDNSFAHVPGPLPALGAAAAFGASRKLRARIRSAQPNISTEA